MRDEQIKSIIDTLDMRHNDSKFMYRTECIVMSLSFYHGFQRKADFIVDEHKGIFGRVLGLPVYIDDGYCKRMNAQYVIMPLELYLEYADVLRRMIDPAGKSVCREGIKRV